ncbi:MAG: RidA family protein [Thiohalorhabdus sp.]|uniref:RidA family protein n=1 Tax=Thiohalorhabdus sp. TaxID=3094134 RepID=UPI0039812237
MYFRENYHTDAAPQAIGPYSQAVRAGELVFISGQIPLDPVTMELVDGDFRRQVEQVLTNIEAVASAAGGTLCQVVKLTVYLTDLAKFEVVNEVLDDYFLEPYPARAALGVAALPKGAEVEMEAIMHVEPGEAE